MNLKNIPGHGFPNITKKINEIKNKDIKISR